MNTTNNPQEPNLGYRFIHLESNHAPGGSLFEICINESPTEHHFDPERLHLLVESRASAVESLTIRHPWFFEHNYHALAGSIELTDRYGKEVEAYTFGGSLKIKSQDTFTVCTLESPAPILEISTVDPILMMFIEEIEILFAKRRAALLSNLNTYEKHLVKADPLELCLACLNALIEKYKHLHHKEEPRFGEFLKFLQGENGRLKNESKTAHFVPKLEEIL